MKTKFKLVLLTFILLITDIKAQEPHHGALTANGSLYFRAEPVNNFLPDKAGDIYYYIHLEGIEKTLTGTKEHVPLNISVVLDHSGSMEGDKLNYTKEALKYIINQLDSRDVLSIVLYDSDVEVFLQPQRLEDRKELLARVEKIASGSSTNLEGGIRKGYELVKNSKKLIGSEMINRVLLLSDGLANVGMSDPESLSALTRDFFEKDRISISTFGVGNDYNENLMARMAMQGGGLYYFIHSPEKLPSIFNEELKGMSKLIAKNTVLKIKFPDDVLSYDRTYAFNSVVKGNTLEINFNDLFATEQKAVLIRFKTKGKLKAALTIECGLSYSNCNVDPMLAVTDNRISEIKIAADEKEYNSGYNHAASEGYVLEITSELYDQALEASNDEHYTDAKNKVQEALTILDDHFKRNGENLFLRDFEKKLKEYSLLIDDMKNMDRETFRYNIKLSKEDGAKRKIRAKF
ncbi:MAG: vWA domain-containing protein [Bacteroidia bacterium]